VDACTNQVRASLAACAAPRSASIITCDQVPEPLAGGDGVVRGSPPGEQRHAGGPCRRCGAELPVRRIWAGLLAVVRETFHQSNTGFAAGRPTETPHMVTGGLSLLGNCAGSDSPAFQANLDQASRRRSALRVRLRKSPEVTPQQPLSDRWPFDVRCRLAADLDSLCGKGDHGGGSVCADGVGSWYKLSLQQCATLLSW